MLFGFDAAISALLGELLLGETRGRFTASRISISLRDESSSPVAEGEISDSPFPLSRRERGRRIARIRSGFYR